MITVDLSSGAPANVRWAISPVLEALGWLRLTRDEATDPTYGAPAPAARELLDRRDVALVAELLPPRDEPTPDFLAPAPPEVSSADIVPAQLEEIRGTEHPRAAVEVCEAFGDRALPPVVVAALHEGNLPARAAHGLELFWSEGMSDVFDTAQVALRAEIDRCTQVAETGGISAALNAVHERLSSEDGAPGLCDRCTDLGAGASALVVIPTALYGPRLAMRLEGEQPFVAYPIGVAPELADPVTGLRRLLGPTRAAILRHLSSARTTTELSEELRLATATVSYHVKVMQRAGLLERTRRRHNVFYELSPTGRRLLSSIP